MQIFQRIFDFPFQRSALQAFGWYIIMALLSSLVCGIAGGIAGALQPAQSFESGLRVGRHVGPIVAAILVTICSILLIKPRGLSVLGTSLALIGVFLSLLLGVFAGLIPLAILTTRPADSRSADAHG